MKTCILVIILSAVNNYALYAQFTAPNWQKAIGITGQHTPLNYGSYSLNAYATACDPSGNVYVTGEVKGTANFSGTTIDGGMGTLGSVYVARYNSDNTLLWVKTYGSGMVRNIAAGSDGNIYVYGLFYSTITMGTITLNAVNGARDVFVAKLHGNGDVTWAKNGGGQGYMFSYVHGMSLSANNDVLISASSDALIEAKFGNLTLPKGRNFFVKYDSDGNISLAKVAFANSNASTHDIASDKEGNIFITGGFGDTLKFDDGTNVPSIGNIPRAYIAKYDPQGNLKWVRSAGAKGSAHGLGLVCDLQKNVYMFGEADSMITFGSITSAPDNQAKFFLAKYDSTGTVQWVNRFGGPGSSGSYEFTAQDICLDKNGNINVMGNFINQLQFSAKAKINATRLHAIFVAQYNSAGNFMWATAGGGFYENKAGGISVDNNNNIYAAGAYTGDTATFGYNVLIGPFTNNAYLVKIADVTGIQSAIQSFFKVAAYPNPVTNELTITGLQQNTQVQLFDVLGRVLKNFKSFNDKEVLNTVSLTPGNYVLILTNTSGEKTSFKITKE